MKANYGQSLTEYGLVAGLVTLVAIAGLMRLGVNLSDIFHGMFPGTGQQPVAVTAAGSTPSPVPAVSPLPPISTNATSVVNAALLKNVPISTKALTTSVQTAGVNGTTTILADTITSTANRLKEEGKIDEATYSNIVALANQGHKLAQIEAAIDVAASNSGSSGAVGFDTSSATLNGKTYSGPDIVAQIADNSPDVLAFQQLQNQVLSSAALTDPAAKDLISQLSGNILNIASAAATSGNWIDQDGVGINTYQSYLDDFPNLISDYANNTTANSNNICATQNQSSACMR